jgi:phosphoribosylaminoimidazolecarboxamide formyltransferase/IMP cyclohydrolase
MTSLAQHSPLVEPVDLVPVRRALLSLSDKSDLIPFARALADLGVELVSTGGTATALAAAGIPVVPIESLTGFPEILDGRVKTLHPKVHGGLLARRDLPEHVDAMRAHGIEPIDLVCINLYPFESTVSQPGVRDVEAIEQIDIGGPSMIRSAAKNHAHVAVVTSPSQYDAVANDLRQHRGCTTLALRRSLAASAFSRTAGYDAAIAAWFDRSASREFPNVLQMVMFAAGDLRYGENPHQRAAVYRDPRSAEPSVVSARLLHGKPLSYNNILDAAAALELVQDLADQADGSCACAVVKHTNPCGAALAPDARAAFELAYAGDPLAAYGGIVACSSEVDARAAEALADERRFLEVIVAPRFSEDAVAALAARSRNVRLLACGDVRHRSDRPLSFRSVPGGMLAQERDTLSVRGQDLTVAAGPEPTDEMRADAAFALAVVKHLKSNAVCITAGRQLWGAGAGQMDRVASCRIAAEKAHARLAEANAARQGTPHGAGNVGAGNVGAGNVGAVAGAASPAPVAASDAFFPFADGPQILIDAGVRCIVHPGGSKRDSDTFDACAKAGVTCLISGTRHFRH